MVSLYGSNFPGSISCQNLSFSSQSLDIQYSETVDRGGLSFLPLFQYHRVPPEDLIFGILSDMQGSPTGGPPGGPGGHITYP